MTLLIWRNLYYQHHSVLRGPSPASQRPRTLTVSAAQTTFCQTEVLKPTTCLTLVKFWSQPVEMPAGIWQPMTGVMTARHLVLALNCDGWESSEPRMTTLLQSLVCRSLPRPLGPSSNHQPRPNTATVQSVPHCDCGFCTAINALPPKNVGQLSCFNCNSNSVVCYTFGKHVQLVSYSFVALNRRATCFLCSWIPWWYLSSMFTANVNSLLYI